MHGKAPHREKVRYLLRLFWIGNANYWEQATNNWLAAETWKVYICTKNHARSTVRFRGESFVGELHREKSIHPKNKPPAQLKMRGFQWLLVCAILCVQLKYYSSQQVVEFFGTCTNDDECPDYAQCENAGGIGNQCRCEDGFDAIDGIITSVGNAVTECRGIWYFILYILYISTILPFCIKSWCYKIANNELLFLFFLIVWSTWSKTRYIMYNCGCFSIKSRMLSFFISDLGPCSPYDNKETDCGTNGRCVTYTDNYNVVKAACKCAVGYTGINCESTYRRSKVKTWT